MFINRIDGFIEEKEGDKHLNITLADRNSEVLRKYSEVWNGIKDCIEKIDDIPLNKQLYLPTITVTIRNIFEKDDKYYPQIFLDEFLHEI